MYVRQPELERPFRGRFAPAPGRFSMKIAVQVARIAIDRLGAR